MQELAGDPAAFGSRVDPSPLRGWVSLGCGHPGFHPGLNSILPRGDLFPAPAGTPAFHAGLFSGSPSGRFKFAGIGARAWRWVFCRRRSWFRDGVDRRWKGRRATAGPSAALGM